MYLLLQIYIFNIIKINLNKKNIKEYIFDGLTKLIMDYPEFKIKVLKAVE